MNQELILGPEAEGEVLNVRNWYDVRSPGLGPRFLGAVDAALTRIKQNPLQYQIAWKQYRRARIRRYLYYLIYRISDQTIRVVACIHGSRNPETWQKRT